MRFIDTNVLLYDISEDPRDVQKRRIANGLLRNRDLGLSVQVLQEFYSQATRPDRADRITHRQAADAVLTLRRYPVQEMTFDLVLAAMETRDRFQISYWDAAIIEAARALGCTEVLSEDLSDGQDYGGILVVNPFA